MGASWKPLRESWGRLGSLSGGLRNVLVALGKLFQVSERPLGRSWAPLGDFWEKVLKKDAQMN